MANLYEVRADILACIDLETGEVIDLERLEALQMERDTKIDNILSWIKNLTADADAIEKEEKALRERRRVLKNKADSLTKYVSEFLAGQKWSSPRNQVGWRRSETVEWTDEAAALSWCKEHAQSAVIEAAPTIDKKTVKALIKSGVNVAGALVVEHQNIQIR